MGVHTCLNLLELGDFSLNSFLICSLVRTMLFRSLLDCQSTCEACPNVDVLMFRYSNRDSCELILLFAISRGGTRLSHDFRVFGLQECGPAQPAGLRFSRKQAVRQSQRGHIAADPAFVDPPICWATKGKMEVQRFGVGKTMAPSCTPRGDHMLGSRTSTLNPLARPFLGPSWRARRRVWSMRMPPGNWSQPLDAVGERSSSTYALPLAREGPSQLGCWLGTYGGEPPSPGPFRFRDEVNTCNMRWHPPLFELSLCSTKPDNVDT